jgi:hypothetical protein
MLKTLALIAGLATTPVEFSIDVLAVPPGGVVQCTQSERGCVFMTIEDFQKLDAYVRALKKEKSL